MVDRQASDFCGAGQAEFARIFRVRRDSHCNIEAVGGIFNFGFKVSQHGRPGGCGHRVGEQLGDCAYFDRHVDDLAHGQREIVKRDVQAVGASRHLRRQCAGGRDKAAAVGGAGEHQFVVGHAGIHKLPGLCVDAGSQAGEQGVRVGSGGLELVVELAVAADQVNPVTAAHLHRGAKVQGADLLGRAVGRLRGGCHRLGGWRVHAVAGIDGVVAQRTGVVGDDQAELVARGRGVAVAQGGDADLGYARGCQHIGVGTGGHHGVGSVHAQGVNGEGEIGVVRGQGQLAVGLIDHHRQGFALLDLAFQFAQDCSPILRHRDYRMGATQTHLGQGGAFSGVVLVCQDARNRQQRVGACRMGITLAIHSQRVGGASDGGQIAQVYAHRRTRFAALRNRHLAGASHLGHGHGITALGHHAGAD